MLLALRKLERTCSNKSLWGWRGGAPLYHISKLQHYRSTFFYHMSQLLYYKAHSYTTAAHSLPTKPLSFATGEQSYNTVVRLLQAHACTREARSCTTGAHACTILQEYTPALWKHVHLQQSQMASPLASAFKNLFWWRGQPVGRNSLPSHKKCHKEQGGWQVDDWVKHKICFGVHVPTWQVLARLGSQMKKSWKREPLQLERLHPKSNENLLVKNSSARTSWHSS